MKEEKEDSSLFGSLPMAEIGTRFLDNLAEKLLENKPKRGKPQSAVQKIAAQWAALDAEKKRATLNRIAEVALAAGPMLGLIGAASGDKKKKASKAEEVLKEVAHNKKKGKKKAKKK